MEIPPFMTIGTFSIITIIISVLIIMLINKTNLVNEYQRTLVKLKKSFNDLDEQAKLIVRTDLELNKAQEELDKRLSGLEALQKTSRLISTTLEEDEIFHRLKQSLKTDLDYEKSLILIYDSQNNFDCKIHQGFSEESVQFILGNLQKDAHLITSLNEGNTFSSANSPKQRAELIVRIFEVEHFVISPILTQNGIIGIVFVGNQSNAMPITEGDEELIAILANQIGQSLENARLFEQVYSSSQMLESKVQDRTKQLADALAEVQNISKTKSEFISAVSHELRTPLTSIKGYAAILIEGKLGAVPDKAKERLAKINTHSDNLVKLINDLLDISRIESGRVEMNIGRCDLNKIIENMQDLLTPQMIEKNIQCKIDYINNIPEMFLDSSQIERVFINLVGNAIKFTPEKGTISIKVVHKNKIVTVEVSDTGIGIPKDAMTRLFDEFYRVENQINQNVKGTGLGLPLAKKIVEAHNGKMWVTSEVHEGTTFHFTLPVWMENEKVKIKEEKTT